MLVALALFSLVSCQSDPCNAIPILVEDGGGTVTLFGSNINMDYYFESSCNRGNAGTVWYSISPAYGQYVTVTTCGQYTDFDTTIGVYSGVCNNLMCKEFNDDAQCGEMVHVNERGLDWWWGSWWGSWWGGGYWWGGNYWWWGGNYWLDDDFFYWFDDDLSFSVSSFTSFFSTFTYIISESEWDFDDDELSSVSFVADGSTYYIGVSGYDEEGHYQLTVSFSDPSYSGCGSAIDIAGDYYTPVSVNGVIGDNRIGIDVCSEFEYYNYGVWYKIHPQPGHQMSISTCNSATNFDTRLAVISGTDCLDLYCIDENDDDYCELTGRWTSSTISFLPSLSEYYVIVAAFDDDDNSNDNFVLTLSQSTLGENIPCINAFPINIGITGDPEGNTNNANPLSQSICSDEYGKADWFTVTSPTAVTVEFTTCNSITTFDTMLSIYGGTCESLSCIAFNDDDGSCSENSSLSTVQVTLNANEIVFLVITGYGGGSGTYLLNYSIL